MIPFTPHDYDSGGPPASYRRHGKGVTKQRESRSNTTKAARKAARKRAAGARRRNRKK